MHDEALETRAVESLIYLHMACRALRNQMTLLFQLLTFDLFRIHETHHRQRDLRSNASLRWLSFDNQRDAISRWFCCICHHRSRLLARWRSFRVALELATEGWVSSWWCSPRAMTACGWKSLASFQWQTARPNLTLNLRSYRSQLRRITNLSQLLLPCFNGWTYGSALAISWRSRWAAHPCFPLLVVSARKQHEVEASSQRIARFSA